MIIFTGLLNCLRSCFSKPNDQDSKMESLLSDHNAQAQMLPRFQYFQSLPPDILTNITSFVPADRKNLSLTNRFFFKKSHIDSLILRDISESEIQTEFKVQFALDWGGYIKLKNPSSIIAFILESSRVSGMDKVSKIIGEIKTEIRILVKSQESLDIQSKMKLCLDEPSVFGAILESKIENLSTNQPETCSVTMIWQSMENLDLREENTYKSVVYLCRSILRGELVSYPNLYKINPNISKNISHKYVQDYIKNGVLTLEEFLNLGSLDKSKAWQAASALIDPEIHGAFEAKIIGRGVIRNGIESGDLNTEKLRNVIFQNKESKLKLERDN